jgi:hypothetical protein
LVAAGCKVPEAKRSLPANSIPWAKVETPASSHGFLPSLVNTCVINSKTMTKSIKIKGKNPKIK